MFIYSDINIVSRQSERALYVDYFINSDINIIPRQSERALYVDYYYIYICMCEVLLGPGAHE